MMTRTFRFGPGSLESLTLKVWTARQRGGRREGMPRQIKATLIGFYTVYGEFGDERVVINEGASAWTSEDTDEARKLASARAGDQEAAEDLAGDLINYALEDWTSELEVEVHGV